MRIGKILNGQEVEAIRIELEKCNSRVLEELAKEIKNEENICFAILDESEL